MKVREVKIVIQEREPGMYSWRKYGHVQRCPYNGRDCGSQCPFFFLDEENNSLQLLCKGLTIIAGRE